MRDAEQAPLCGLPDAIIKHSIAPFLGSRRDLAAVAGACRSLRSLLVSPSCAQLWDEASEAPFSVCIDGYCPNCRSRGSVESAARFLSRFPILRLDMHCFLSHLPVCIESLAKLSLVQSLQLSFTNKASTPPLDTLLAQSGLQEKLSHSTFARLRELTLNSLHLHHVNLAGRARLLDLLGRELRVLRFEHLSPSGVFSMISSKCPALTSLRIDKATTLTDFQRYNSSALQELELLRCHFIPNTAHLTKLQKLKFSAAFRMEECQIKSLVQSFPTSLQSLSLEIPGAHANIAVRTIARRLPELQTLSLEANFEKGLISRNAISFLGARCPSLQSIELKCSRSIAPLGFETAEAFVALGVELRALRCVRVMLDEVILSALPRFLALFADKGPHLQISVQRRWMSPSLWNTTLRHLADLCRQFPHCKLSLDIS